MTLTPTVDLIRFPPLTSAVFVTATPTTIPPTLTPTINDQNVDQMEVPVFAPTRIIPTLRAGKSNQLSTVKMIDANIGWGIYLESGKVLRSGFQGDPYLWLSEGYILRTTDGGKTWHNVTPSSGAYSAGGFFALDANRAWGQ